MAGDVESVVTSGQLPSVEEIRHELVEVRRTGGLGLLQVQKHLPLTMLLPAVDDEMRRRRQPEENRAAATMSVVTCAANRAVPDPRHRVFLRHTLDFDNADFDVSRRRPMERRFAHACDALGLSMGESARVVMASAYTELAGVLVAAEDSPCIRMRPHSDARKELSRLIEDVSDMRKRLELALALLAEEPDPELRATLIRSIDRTLGFLGVADMASLREFFSSHPGLVSPETLSHRDLSALLGDESFGVEKQRAVFLAWQAATLGEPHPSEDDPIWAWYYWAREVAVVRMANAMFRAKEHGLPRVMRESPEEGGAIS